MNNSFKTVFLLILLTILTIQLTGRSSDKTDKYKNPESTMNETEDITRISEITKDNKITEYEAIEISDSAMTIPEEKTLKYNFQYPVKFSEYKFENGYLSGHTLIFECINGTYDESEAYWGRTWSGTFQFRLVNNDPEESSEEVISCTIEQSFYGPFELHIKDYNNDGLEDFALVQFWSSSGGDAGRMFTIKENGTVEEIPVSGDKRYISSFGLIGLKENDTGVFMIPYTHINGSPDLERTENGFLVKTDFPFRRGADSDRIYFMDEFKEEYIENNAYLLDIYEWNGESFVLTEQIIQY